MADSDITDAEDLPNKPLGEAIFELRWAIQTDQGGLQRDPGFGLLYGRYYDHLSKPYPFIEDLPVSQVPEDMSPYVVRHRFRPAQNAWPVAQIGPGIITINDTESYKWRDFQSRVLAAVHALFDSYPSQLNELVPIGAQLTYINAVPFDPSKESMTRFLRDNLHVSIGVDPSLFERTEAAEKPIELNLNMAFPLTKPDSMGILRFSNGRKNQQPALVWQIVIRSSFGQVPKDQSGFGVWLNDAHDVAEKWFFTLVRGNLRETFEESHGNRNT